MEGKILVTGGAGYIGSHAVRQLIKNGFDVIVLDNLSTGHVKAVDPKAEIIIGDVRDLALLDSVFSNNNIVGVMQFAGKIIVPESVSHPISYYDDNFTAVVSVLRAMKAHGCKNIVFSSTAAVYGTSDSDAITEEAPLHPESPYGFSKLAAERLICDCERAYGIKHCIFRYFNVAGASEDSSIGEAHPVETHLIPVTVISSLNGVEMQIFGNDYKTRDGTNLRDYIHVLDLADAHVLGMQMLLEGKDSAIINLGSDKGYTNKEIVETVSKVTGIPVKWKYGPRRPGDADSIVASNALAKKLLGWEPTRKLEEMIRDDFNWRKKNKNLYGRETTVIAPEIKKKIQIVKPSKHISALYEEEEIHDKKKLQSIKTKNNI